MSNTPSSSNPEKNPKKILFISQFYYPDITAAAFRIKETVDYFCSRGHKVYVIGAVPHRGFAADAIIVDDGRAKVARIPILPHHGAGKWNFIAHYLSFMFGAIWASWKLPSRFDVVLASSPPLFVGIAGWVVAGLKRAKFVLDVRDIWPDSAVSTGQISGRGFLFAWAKLAERFLYRSADLLSCVATPMAEYVENESAGKRPLVVYNGVPKRLWEETGVVAATLPSDGKFEILYVGNMGHCQNLDLAVESAKRLQAEGRNDVKFTLIGEGYLRPELEKAVGDFNLKNVVIAGPVSKTTALEIMRKSSALFLTLKSDVTMEKTIPSKVFDYMAAGKPILFGIQGEGGKILSEIPGNIHFDSASVDSLTAAIYRLTNDYATFARAAVGNRESIEKNFLREKMAEKLERKILELFT